MITTLSRLPRTTWRVAKATNHAFQAFAAKAYGRPIGGLKTDLQVNGKDVVFFIIRNQAELHWENFSMFLAGHMSDRSKYLAKS